jgi:hypothetical protein
VLDHLPERDRPAVKRRLRAAWKLPAHRATIDRVEAIASELARSHPGAAVSLREGLTETVTLQRLGVHQQLRKTLSSTNPIESMIGICRATSRNVKRWQTATCACAGPPPACSKPSARSARSSATSTSPHSRLATTSLCSQSLNPAARPIGPSAR